MKQIRFVIGGDGPEYDGQSDGETWNGWDVVYVTPAVLEQIALDYERMDFVEEADYVRTEPVGPDGLVSLSGWTTSLVGE